jgi:hypothetical protein
LAAFADAFKPVLPAAQDAVVPGLVVSKKRRKATVTLNRDGLAGLNENAASVVGSVTYARTRTDFFQDADDGEAMVCASLRADGFVFTDEEYADWWALKGHKLRSWRATRPSTHATPSATQSRRPCGGSTVRRAAALRRAGEH